VTKSSGSNGFRRFFNAAKGFKIIPYQKRSDRTLEKFGLKVKTYEGEQTGLNKSLRPQESNQASNRKVSRVCPEFWA
jgi:hypothetical protein